MPHTARKRGESGFYHVVAKGDGGQIIFEGDWDRRRFLAELGKSLEKRNVKLHAYCLMSNHVHLLLQDSRGELGEFMKSLCETYAMYFCKRTGRTGRVFRRPYWSEPVETDEYFLAALRYIHANPEAAGICRACDYPWSSFREYCSRPVLADTQLALEMLGGVEQFQDFSLSGCQFALPFSKSKIRNHLSPDELAHIALEIVGRDTLNSLRGMNREALAPHLKKLASRGFSANEISRVTGIGRSTVSRVLSDP